MGDIGSKPPRIPMVGPPPPPPPRRYSAEDDDHYLQRISNKLAEPSADPVDEDDYSGPNGDTYRADDGRPVTYSGGPARAYQDFAKLLYVASNCLNHMWRADDPLLETYNCNFDVVMLLREVDVNMGWITPAYWARCVRRIARNTDAKYDTDRLFGPNYTTMETIRRSIVTGAYCPWDTDDALAAQRFHDPWMYRFSWIMTWMALIRAGVITGDNQRVLYKLNPRRINFKPNADPRNHHSDQERVFMAIALRAVVKQGLYPLPPTHVARVALWKRAYQDLPPRQHVHEDGTTTTLRPTLTCADVMRRMSRTLAGGPKALYSFMMFNDMVEITGRDVVCIKEAWEELETEWYSAYLAGRSDAYPPSLESYFRTKKKDPSNHWWQMWNLDEIFEGEKIESNTIYSPNQGYNSRTYVSSYKIAPEFHPNRYATMYSGLFVDPPLEFAPPPNPPPGYPCSYVPPRSFATT